MWGVLTGVVGRSNCRRAITSFPSAAIAVEREKEQRENHLVDFFFVVVHGVIFPRIGSGINLGHDRRVRVKEPIQLPASIAVPRAKVARR